MCKTKREKKIRNAVIYPISLIILVVHFSACSIVEDEARVNSEGMWQIPLSRYSQYQSAASANANANRNGNSRFDVGGLITTIGLQQGASLLGLVVFPFLLPIMVLFSIALFIISMFGGTTPVLATVTGRRFDSNGSESLTPPDNSNSPSSFELDLELDLVSDLLKSQECLERMGCEILSRSGDKVGGWNSSSGSSRKTKTKILSVLKLLRKFNIFPNSLEKVDIAVRKGSSCSVFKCSLQDYFNKSRSRRRYAMAMPKV